MKGRSAHGGGSPEAPRDKSPIAQEEDAGEVEDKEVGEGSNSLIWFGLGVFLFLLFCAFWRFGGEGVAGIPHYDGASSSGVGNGYT